MIREMEITKTTYGGGLGENKAEVTEEKRNPQTEDAKHASDLAKRAGEVFLPLGAEYLGSAIIHYYSKAKLLSAPDFFVACQLNVSKVTEHHADLGHRQLRTALMDAFGRARPRTVKR